MTRCRALLLSALMCAAFGGTAEAKRVAPPDVGVYHCAHPDFGLDDDLVTKGRVRGFVRLAGRNIVWSYVSFHWYKDFVFPKKQCDTLNSLGVVPLVGMMPHSSSAQNVDEPLYTLKRIIAGYFDESLRECARTVRSLGYPVMIEFGPECNGPWFPWSASRNGKDADEYGERGVPDGAERFRDAYRHVVDLFRAEGADDVTWVFHVSESATRAPWNDIAHYYPGDDHVDWIGTSIYGRLRGDEPARPLSDMMRDIYPKLCALSETRPIALLEIGVADSRIAADKAKWIADAYRDIWEGRYPRVKAVAWWNKTYRADGTRSMLEIDSSAESLAAYREGAADLRTRASFVE